MKCLITFKPVIPVNEIARYLSISPHRIYVVEDGALEPDIITDTTVLITRGGIHRQEEYTDKIPGLSIIGRPGSGIEFINRLKSLKKGILYLNSGEASAQAVAEHTLLLALILIKKYKSFAKEIEELRWNRLADIPSLLKGKTAGIIGMGNCGLAFAKIIHKLGGKVIFYDPYLFLNRIPYQQVFSFDELLPLSDIISIHVNYTEKTRYLINEETLCKCKKNAIIINTARGGVVNTAHILNALIDGRISGYAADVFEYENESFSAIKKEGISYLQKLRSLNTVVITPHIAGSFPEIRLLTEKLSLIHI